MTHSDDQFSLTYEDLKKMLDWKDRLEELSVKCKTLVSPKSKTKTPVPCIECVLFSLLLGRKAICGAVFFVRLLFCSSTADDVQDADDGDGAVVPRVRAL